MNCFAEKYLSIPSGCHSTEIPHFLFIYKHEPFQYDDEEDEIEVIKDNEFVVDGSTRLEDFNEIVGTELESEEVDTIAGYILQLLGNFPKNGEVIETDGLRIVVEEMDKNRIEKVRVYK